MKTAFELFNWYFSIHEKTDKKGVRPYRLDAADLAICLKEYDKELKATNDLSGDGQVSKPINDTLELEKAYNQCHKCFSSWNYRGKQDQGWCYTFRDYMPTCEKYRYK